MPNTFTTSSSLSCSRFALRASRSLRSCRQRSLTEDASVPPRSSGRYGERVSTFRRVMGCISKGEICLCLQNGFRIPLICTDTFQAFQIMGPFSSQISYVLLAFSPSPHAPLAASAQPPRGGPLRRLAEEEQRLQPKNGVLSYNNYINMVFQNKIPLPG